jgi:trehalose synthase
MEKVLNIGKYRKIVGDEEIDRIYEEASPLSEKRIVHVNSTYLGGGVAEILRSLVPLMNDVGIKTEWIILHGAPDFFIITKKFHNALQGETINLSEMKKRIYLLQNEINSVYHHVDHDCVIIHDHQPLPLITFYEKKQPWIWRCHVDLSAPNPEVWDYLRNYIIKYDAAIFSSEKFKRKLSIPQHIIVPSIDPLSPKNKKISEKTISKYLSKFKIDRDKPIISQVSRFDKWKDPEGVIKVFELVKKEVDCKLVLLGSMAIDDPEGQRIYENLVRRVGNNEDIILIANENTILVNALQRASSVVLQKSLKEGFGLTISEALWKGTPVIASNVGGIPEQIVDGKSGYLVNPKDIKGCADRVIKLLKNPKLAREMGKYGRQYVKRKFLISRHLLDYINLLKLIIQS